MSCQVLLYRLHQHYQEEPAEELAVAPEAEAVAEMFPADTSYTVQFETNGGSDIASMEVEKNNAATMPEPPVREG